MKYITLSKELYIENRRKFCAKMQPGSIAIIVSNDELNKNGDGLHDYKQSSDMLWLTGMDQEDTWLMLFPDCPNPDFREVLYIKETSETIAIWHGHKHSKEEATALSGIVNVELNSKFEAALHPAMILAQHCYLNLNENDRATIVSENADLRFVRRLMTKFPLHTYHRSAPILQRLRAIKHPEEMKAIRKAIEIVGMSFERVMKFIKPGVMEYEVEAETIHEFIRNGATGNSFQPIVASGASACVLHYVENNRPLKDGDLLLLDHGCEYANYCSDLTRVMPVNGKFTARQKEVYDAVLRLQRQAMSMLKPNVIIMDYHQEMGKYITEECIALGLLTKEEVRDENPKWPAYKKYCVHGISHFLGLDVHDVGMRWEPLQAGMVLTCEPGIYIQEEGIGIRIENDVLITASGCEDLMQNFAIETGQIEEVMGKANLVAS
ncbi:MAG: aminopeptidase P family protein [Flavobacteriaceae bacterium]|nr:aminopeptidase P family protein [Flavobacteriaceae bacterium]